MGSTVPSSRRCRLGLGQAARKLLASWAERTGSLEVKRSREIDQFQHTNCLFTTQTNTRGGTQKTKRTGSSARDARGPAMSGSAEPRVKLFAALVAGSKDADVLARVEAAKRLGAGRVVLLVATPEIVDPLAPSPPQVLPRPSVPSCPRASVAGSATTAFWPLAADADARIDGRSSPGVWVVRRPRGRPRRRQPGPGCIGASH